MARPSRRSTEPEHEPSTERRRWYGRILDGLGFAVVEYVIVSAVLSLVVVEDEAMTPLNTTLAVVPAVVVFVVTAYLYYIWPVRRYGKTPGMALLRLEALAERGSRPSLPQSIRLTLRWLLGDTLWPYWWGDGSPNGVEIVHKPRINDRIRVSGRPRKR
jgi:uncharacterized RDD family membrane protein YckC